jgi:hypothetical protein
LICEYAARGEHAGDLRLHRELAVTGGKDHKDPAVNGILDFPAIARSI